MKKYFLYFFLLLLALQVVADDYIYHSYGGKLYGLKIHRLQALSPWKLIHDCGGNARYYVHDGYVYLSRRGDLRGARIDGFNIKGDMQLVDEKRWDCEFAVNNGYLYAMRDKNLYGVRIDGLRKEGSLDRIDRNGWYGKFAFYRNYLYLMKDRVLYGQQIEGKGRKGSNKLIAKGWKGDAITVVNSYIYLIRGMKIFGCDIDGLRLRGRLRPVFIPRHNLPRPAKIPKTTKVEKKGFYISRDCNEQPFQTVESMPIPRGWRYHSHRVEIFARQAPSVSGYRVWLEGRNLLVKYWCAPHPDCQRVPWKRPKSVLGFRVYLTLVPQRR